MSPIKLLHFVVKLVIIASFFLAFTINIRRGFQLKRYFLNCDGHSFNDSDVIVDHLKYVCDDVYLSCQLIWLILACTAAIIHRWVQS